MFHPPEGWTPPAEKVERLRRLFARDGYEWTPDGKIVGGPEVVADQFLSGLTDATVIRQHLDRIRRAVQHDDPAQAIGSAKELIESTAKLVLLERGLTVTRAEELPALVKTAQEALMIHAIQAGGGPDRAPSVRRILGAANTVAIGVAELRNAGYGTGHGQDVAHVELSARHARLAVNAAKTWCEFVLDTLSDQTAPWRTVQAGAQIP